MATDYFITYTQSDKIALLKGLTETMLTGQVTRVQTAHGVYHEFKPDNSMDLNYARLCDSIASSPDYDPTDPTQLACMGNRRPGITKASFGGAYGGLRGY